MPRNKPIPDLKFGKTEEFVFIRTKANATYFWATADLQQVYCKLEGIQGRFNFEPRLFKTASLNQILTKAADKVDVLVQNVDKLVGLTINNVATRLNRGFCQVGRAFWTAANEWVGEILVTGTISSSDAPEDAATLPCVSDTAPSQGSLTVTPIQPNCPLIYKSRECGYVGTIATCDKTKDGSNGCNVHTTTLPNGDVRGNGHRFGGIKVEGEILEPVFGGYIGYGGYDGRGRRYPDGWVERHLLSTL